MTQSSAATRATGSRPTPMFESLSTPLQDVFKTLEGEGAADARQYRGRYCREIRLALLEADVNFRVAKAFIDRVRDRAMGQDVFEVFRRRNRSSRSFATRWWRCSGMGGGTAADEQAAARHSARRPAGRREDDDRGKAREMARQTRPPCASSTMSGRRRFGASRC